MVCHGRARDIDFMCPVVSCPDFVVSIRRCWIKLEQSDDILGDICRRLQSGPEGTRQILGIGDIKKTTGHLHLACFQKVGVRLYLGQ